MIKIKTESIFKRLYKTFNNIDTITKDQLIEFCNTNNLSYCIITYSEFGLTAKDSFNNYIKVDGLGYFLEGAGIFSKFDKKDEDTTEFVNTLRKYLDSVDELKFDIVYINDPIIQV